MALVHRCARSVCCVACAASRATSLVVTGAPPVPCSACAVSSATFPPSTSVPALSFALLVRRPRPRFSCSPVCPLGVLSCLCGVLGHLAAVHRCAHAVCCVACAVSLASWLMFTGMPPRWVMLRLRCPGPLRSCSPVCLLGGLCCVCGVLGGLAPVHRCACMICCVACAVSWAAWHLFTGAAARCLVLRVRCPGPLGSCSPVSPRGLLCCVCGVLGHLAPVHRCSRSVCCVACAVSWATWLLFTSVPVWCVVLRSRCPGPLGSCSPVCPLGGLCCVCGVLGHLAPVHRCARSVGCVACALSWTTWLLFTGVLSFFVVLGLRCPRPLGSHSPVRLLCVLCCVCAVLGYFVPVHQCARWVCPVACAVSWATWLLFTGVPVPSFALLLCCPGPRCSCSPVCQLGALLGVCGLPGHLAAVHRYAHALCCVVRAVSWATWLLFTGVPAPCVVLRVRRPGPLGS